MSLVGLHHVHLRVPDLGASRAFMADFGLVEAGEDGGRLFLRGSGPAAYLVVLEQGAAPSLGALAFEVDGQEDLERAAKLEGASGVFELDGLCGGQAVSLTDPEGNHIQLVHGIEKQPAKELRPGMVLNFGHDKQRRGASQSVAPLGPAPILRLGHVGMFVRNAKAAGEWYGRMLGLLPSDLMYAGVPENIVAGFYRVDRGDEWVDHHSLALFGMGKTDVHHVSFEVQDSEVQFMAHRWMARHGHDSVWGVGRHPKGSHIFDVWRDPSGYRFETFSDTDLCTADRPPDVFPIEQAEMDMWSDRSFEAYFA